MLPTDSTASGSPTDPEERVFRYSAVSACPQGTPPVHDEPKALSLARVRMAQGQGEHREEAMRVAATPNQHLTGQVARRHRGGQVKRRPDREDVTTATTGKKDGLK